MLKLFCSGSWSLMLWIRVLCRENHCLVRDLWLSPYKMKRGNTCQDMSLVEEICFLQWDTLWVAKCNILKMLLLATMHLCDFISCLLPTLKKVCNYSNYFETVLLGCLFSDTLLSVNRLLVSFDSGLTHILSGIFIKTFSIVTKHDPTTFQKKVV